VCVWACEDCSSEADDGGVNDCCLGTFRQHWNKQANVQQQCDNTDERRRANDEDEKQTHPASLDRASDASEYTCKQDKQSEQTARQTNRLCRATRRCHQDNKLAQTVTGFSLQCNIPSQRFVFSERPLSNLPSGWIQIKSNGVHYQTTENRRNIYWRKRTTESKTTVVIGLIVRHMHSNI